MRLLEREFDYARLRGRLSLPLSIPSGLCLVVQDVTSNLVERSPWDGADSQQKELSLAKKESLRAWHGEGAITLIAFLKAYVTISFLDSQIARQAPRLLLNKREKDRTNPPMDGATPLTPFNLPLICYYQALPPVLLGARHQPMLELFVHMVDTTRKLFFLVAP